MTTIRAHFDGKTIVPDEPVDLPTDTPLFVFVENKRPMTGKDILESDLIGLWKDRTDVGDSIEYARQLRRQAQTRRRD
jgi:hypothetical protein